MECLNGRSQYSYPGYYDVKLTVTNDCGEDSKLKHLYITVRPVCLRQFADFTANVTSGNAPLAVEFTDTSNNNPAFWQWAFGDGGYSNLQNPVHTYTHPGTYSVGLTVMNSAGTDNLTKQNYITVYPGEQQTHAFYGNLTIDGLPCVKGTNVTAIVSGGGGSVITVEPGLYGRQDGQKLDLWSELRAPCEGWRRQAARGVAQWQKVGVGR